MTRRFLSQTARPALRVLSLALLAASAYAAGVGAQPGQTFYVTGLFEDGAILGGDLTLNAAGTAVYGIAMTVTPTAGGPLSFNGAPSPQAPTTATPDDYYFADSNNGGYTLDLDLDLGAATTLSGYTGGALCSDTDQSCGGALSGYSQNQQLDPPMVVGNVSSSPEPSSALLLFGGAAALIGLRQRRRRA